MEELIMKFFNNLTTRAKLFLSFGLIWAMFLIVIIIAYFGIKDITKSERELHDIHFQIALELRQLRSNINYCKAEVVDMMLSQDKTIYLEIRKKVNDRIYDSDSIIEKISRLDMEISFQNQIKEFKNEINKYNQSLLNIISKIEENKTEENKTIKLDILNESIYKIRLIAIRFGDKEIKDAENQLTLDMQKADSSILLFIIIGLLAFFFSVIIVIAMNKSIAQPLNIISGIAKKIASGDLTIIVQADERRDEVGILNNAFYGMVVKLRNSIKDIIEGVNMLGSSASEILAATTQVASGAAETATAISETTTTVEEVRQAAQLSSQKARNVSENSHQVAQITLNGQKAVDETIAGMHDIQHQMEAVADTIIRLSEQSQQIGGIIASVNDVADQSNLLAVNAAIEAAKAGEQGKGFAVVAQEIKSLALQSKQATTQVRNILSDVQKATSAAVMATEQTSKAVESGVKQSTQAGDAIRKLTESSTKAIEAAVQIVSSSQQQAVGMDQIGLAMTNINQAGLENSASMVQAEKAAKNLHELGQKLEFLVEQYKI